MTACTAVPASTPSRAPGRPSGAALVQREQLLDAAPNRDRDPRLLVVSLIGLTLFPYASAPIWRGLFAAPELDDEALDRHTLALLERGLESPRAP